MFAAVMAAIISTADSLLLLAAGTFSNDIYSKLKPNVSDKEILNVSRVATLVIGIGAVLLSFWFNDAIQFIQARAVTLMGAAMAMLTMVGVVWKRANRTGAAVSMVAGFATRLRLVRTGPTRRCNGCPARSHRGLLGDGGSQQTDPSPSRRSHRQVLLRIGNRITGLSNFDSCATIQTDW